MHKTLNAFLRLKKLVFNLKAQRRFKVHSDWGPREIDTFFPKNVDDSPIGASGLADVNKPVINSNPCLIVYVLLLYVNL